MCALKSRLGPGHGGSLKVRRLGLDDHVHCIFLQQRALELNPGGRRKCQSVVRRQQRPGEESVIAGVVFGVVEKPICWMGLVQEWTARTHGVSSIRSV